MDPMLEAKLLTTRRHLLGSMAGGIGAIAMHDLLAATASAPPRQAPWSPRGTRPPRSPDVAHTYSLRVAAPLDELLTTLAQRFSLALDLDRAALERRGIAPREIVRLDVKDASREALLDAVLDPLGLGWQIEGKTLRVGDRK